MKHFLITILILLMSFGSSWAQDQEEIPYKEMKTVLGKGNKIRGFGSIDTRLTEFNDDLGMLVGAHGGIILNNSFVIGLGGYGLTTNFKFQGTEPDEELYLYGGYGGLVLGAIFAPKEVVHIYTPVLIGAGGIRVSDRNLFRNGGLGDFRNFIEDSAFFVIEPGIEVEVNITRFFKVGMGASYRIVGESDLINVSNKDLSGFSGGLSLKFGKF